jgi:ATP-dependent Clp protease ATP-binding subunit ClpA
MVMPKRLSADARKLVLTSATEEARRRGDRRLGTDHLLLGLLRDENSQAAKALGVSLADARAASDALDLAALAAVGIQADALSGGPSAPFGRRLPPLTSGARAVFKRAIDEARPVKTGRIGTAHFLLALLSLQPPDPAAELLGALGADPAAVRKRLGGPAESGAG